jgi:quinol monooxygenase YgiN
MRSAIHMILPAMLLTGACATSEVAEEPEADDDDTTALEQEYTVVVKARLATDDPDLNQQAHDAVAGGAQEDAMALGDLSHFVFLGMEDEQDFLAIDVWDNLENIPAFFENPDVQQAFSSLFEAPPEVATYDRPEGYTSWGEMEIDDTTLVVTVEGTLALETEDENLELHNEVAEAGREAAQALGDDAHLVYLDLADRRRFLAVDLWSDPEGMQTFFSDEEIQAAFASLFAEPPTVTVWLPSGYLQW